MQISSSQSLGVNFSFPKPSQLTDLDLKYCKANHEVLEQLLKSCHSLEKISLANLTTNSKMLRNICLQNGHSLQVLVLAQCKGLDIESIHHIVNNCFDLKEINLDMTYLSQDAINFLVNKLEPKITSLSLAWLEDVKDENVNVLISRCTNLKALDLRGTPITNDSVNIIIEYLTNSLEELSISYTKINFHKLLDLDAMLKLRNLNCLHLENVEVENLEKKLPHLNINRKMKIATSIQLLEPENGIWDDIESVNRINRMNLFPT